MPKGGEFETCLAGVGNLNQKCQVIPAEYKYYIFKYGDMEVIKVNSSKLWFRGKDFHNPGFKDWSMVRKPRSLILPFRKNLVGHLNTIPSPEERAREFDQTKLEKFKCLGGMLKLRTDRRIIVTSASCLRAHT